MKNKYFKNRKGSSLVFVIMAVLVLVILSTSVVFLFSTNHKQALIQEKNIKEYYLKSSAIDVTISTLLSTLEIDFEGKEKTMIDVIRGKKQNLKLKDEIEIDGQKVGIILSYNKDEDKTNILSRVIYGTEESENSKELSVILEFSGNQHKIVWK